MDQPCGEANSVLQASRRRLLALLLALVFVFQKIEHERLLVGLGDACSDQMLVSAVYLLTG